MAKGRRSLLMSWTAMVFSFFLLLDYPASITADRSNTQNSQGSYPPLKLHILQSHVRIDNGIIKLTLSKPAGMITGVGFNGIDNIMEYRYKETQRGHWDIVWSRPENSGNFFDSLQATSFRVVAESKNQIEVAFRKTWNMSHGDNDLPLNVEKRFVVLRGESGFYSYAIFEHMKGWPDLVIAEARIAFKLHQNTFQYMAVSDKMQKVMPTDSDRKAGHVLDYKEAVLLTNPRNPKLKGVVDDKYQYSCDSKDNRVHGWISSRPHTGFWVITPSDEFRAGGPVKLDLTSHAGATSLAIFFSGHYASPTFGVRLRNGERWKKVFGPVFLYLNSDSGNKPSTLWEDAKKQLSKETMKWPYDFPLSRDFPHANQRGTVRGRLLLRDSYMYKTLVPAKSAYIGLAPPGNVGSWQDESKGYQFWARTDEMGYFTIRSVRAGIYNLYAWVPGIIGDYKQEKDIIITPGSRLLLGHLVYDPPRQGPTLWEIGIPDRTAAEFYIPDPAPWLMNKFYFNNTEKFRQYGLWDRYVDIHPTEDLIYTVGVSHYQKDWFFAHVNRKVDKYYYRATTWQILFDVRNVMRAGTYTLRLAIASANYAEVQVRVNNPYERRPHFTTGQIGKDNAIARHGIHGRYWLFSVNISGFQLKNGRNRIYLKQARGSNPFNGVMYDYIRLEGPPEARKKIAQSIDV